MFRDFASSRCTLLTAVISSYSVEPFIITQWPSLSHFTSFGLKAILSDINGATPVFLKLIFFHSVF